MLLAQRLASTQSRYYKCQLRSVNRERYWTGQRGAALTRAMATSRGGPEVVSAEQAQELLGEGWTYLDVRTKEEFTAGHPDPGNGSVVNIEIFKNSPDGMSINQGFPDELEMKLPRGEYQDKGIIVACKLGQRSQVALQLMAKDYQKLADMKEGWAGWAAKGLPTQQ